MKKSEIKKIIKDFMRERGIKGKTLSVAEFLEMTKQKDFGFYFEWKTNSYEGWIEAVIPIKIYFHYGGIIYNHDVELEIDEDLSINEAVETILKYQEDIESLKKEFSNFISFL
jgi:hypothetical protein